MLEKLNKLVVENPTIVIVVIIGLVIIVIYQYAIHNNIRIPFLNNKKSVESNEKETDKTKIDEYTTKDRDRDRDRERDRSNSEKNSEKQPMKESKPIDPAIVKLVNDINNNT
jgi:cytoskeletal protein RodZ